MGNLKDILYAMSEEEFDKAVEWLDRITKREEEKKVSTKKKEHNRVVYRQLHHPGYGFIASFVYDPDKELDLFEDGTESVEEWDSIVEEVTEDSETGEPKLTGFSFEVYLGDLDPENGYLDESQLVIEETHVELNKPVSPYKVQTLISNKLDSYLRALEYDTYSLDISFYFADAREIKEWGADK